MGRPIVDALAERAGRSYIVGSELSDAIRACRSLEAQGYRGTVAFWNSDAETAGDIAARNVAAIDAIGAEKLDAYVSVKAPPLEFSRELFVAIVERARREGVIIHFDSLWPRSADPTFALIAQLAPLYNEGIGCTLPGRWQRSLADADRAIAMNLSVRVVKGQWPDPESSEADLRTGFLSLVDRIAGRVRHAAVATHDPWLAREAIRRLRAAGTPCELELLFGLPFDRVVSVANAEGIPVRVYVPYGHGSLPYAMRQLKHSPRIAARVLRDLLGRKRSILDVPPVTSPTHPRAPVSR